MLCVCDWCWKYPSLFIRGRTSDPRLTTLCRTSYISLSDDFLGNKTQSISLFGVITMLHGHLQAQFVANQTVTTSNIFLYIEF